MAQWSKPVIIGAVSAVTLLLFALNKNINKGRSSDKKEDAGRLVPNLRFLDTISSQLVEVVMQLTKLEAKIRQELSLSGRALPEDQLASYIVDQFEEAVKAIERQVNAKFQATEDEVKVTSEYCEKEEDKNVVNAVTKLQDLYRVMTGCSVEVPEDLTLQKFVSIVHETMESLNVAMEEVCVEVKELSPDSKEAATNQRYLKRAEALSAEIHAKHGLTSEVLQAALMKFQQEPTFLMAMAELQQEQAQRFAAATHISNGGIIM